MTGSSTHHHGTVVGVFADRAHAKQAVIELRRAGFSEDEIGVVAKHDDTTHGTSGLASDPTGTRWEEGTGIGAAVGAAGGLGLGLAVAAGLIPVIGPIIAGGALTALIASAGAGATAGTVIGGLLGLGVPEDDAGYYEGQFNSGKTLVTVKSADKGREAAAILHQYGAHRRDATTASHTM